MASEVIIEHTKLAQNFTSRVKPVHLMAPGARRAALPPGS